MTDLFLAQAVAGLALLVLLLVSQDLRAERYNRRSLKRQHDQLQRDFDLLKARYSELRRKPRKEN